MVFTPLTLTFETRLFNVKEWLLLALPEMESEQLPSRGQVSVRGELNGQSFRTVLEPDGRWGHWMRVHDELAQQVAVGAGDVVQVTIHTSPDWPEPVVPEDLMTALNGAPKKVKEKWRDITPMARWEWVRWVRATANPDTRAARIEKTVSKLNGDHRRPCCFNLAACTEPYVAKNSQLLPPSEGERLST